MFILVLIDDDIPVLPGDLKHDHKAQLKRQIQNKYVDRIIPNVGLCIEFYDFVRIKEAPIYPGDGKASFGEPYFKVEFNLIVFQPLIDEWMVGSIRQSTKEGVLVTLGFFQDVLIPCSNLRSPYVFDATEKCWVWRYVDKETRHITNYFYEQDALIRFRVVSVEFPDAESSKDKTKVPQMKIIGAADQDGLGLTSWWPDSSAPEEDVAMEEPEPAADAPMEDDDSWADKVGQDGTKAEPGGDTMKSDATTS